MPNQTVERIRSHIDRQFEARRSRNLFFPTAEDSFEFIQETIHQIEGLGGLDLESESTLLDYVTDKSLREFCRINQFYSCRSSDREALRAIYVELLEALKKQNSESDAGALAPISRGHYRRLVRWLRNSNPFAEKNYSTGPEFVRPTVDNEYRAELQIDLLRIDLKNVMPPVLDIGCGRSARLVSLLRQSGIEAFGIDRFAADLPHCEKTDWLDFEYVPRAWGTIVSHLGFSNHFVHHHVREDGRYALYAAQYMQILNSLRVGGRFLYAPGLPFIEQHLDPSRWAVRTQPIEGYGFFSSRVGRLV